MYYKQVFSMSIAFQAATTQETQENEQEDEHTKGREKRHKKQKVIRVVVTGIRSRGVAGRSVTSAAKFISRISWWCATKKFFRSQAT